MSEEKIPTIKLNFKWRGFNPDHRAYKPSNPTITCEYDVVVDVPLTSDLIVNATAIMSQQLVSEKEDYPVLTPLGMRYCIDQFEAAMSTETKNSEETEEDTSSWDDVDEKSNDEPIKKSAKSKKSDDWDDFDTEKKDTDEEKWDENWES